MNDYILGIDENGNVYLEHHGIKGQKWGVIRTPEQLGHKVNPKKPTMSRNAYDIQMTIKTKDKYKPTNEDAYELNSVKQRKLTDEEIRYAVRMAADRISYDMYTNPGKQTKYKILNFMENVMPAKLEDKIRWSMLESDHMALEKKYEWLSDPKHWTFTDDELPDMSMDDAKAVFDSIQNVRYLDNKYGDPKTRDKKNVGISEDENTWDWRLTANHGKEPKFDN